jgi:hypothetical protein
MIKYVKTAPIIEAKNSKLNVKKGPPLAEKLRWSSMTTKFKLETIPKSSHGPVLTVSAKCPTYNHIKFQLLVIRLKNQAHCVFQVLTTFATREDRDHESKSVKNKRDIYVDRWVLKIVKNYHLEAIYINAIYILTLAAINAKKHRLTIVQPTSIIE